MLKGLKTAVIDVDSIAAILLGDKPDGDVTVIFKGGGSQVFAGDDAAMIRGWLESQRIKPLGEPKSFGLTN